jgi:hypothetical protein
MVEVTEM